MFFSASLEISTPWSLTWTEYPTCGWSSFPTHAGTLLKLVDMDSLLEGSTYSQQVGVATVPWAPSSAVGLHEQAGGGSGHLLAALTVSASL